MQPLVYEQDSSHEVLGRWASLGCRRRAEVELRTECVGTNHESLIHALERLHSSARLGELESSNSIEGNT